MSNLITDKELNKLIALAHKSGNAFAIALHNAGKGCLDRIDANGDIRFLNNLAAKLTPKALEALAVWAVKFGKVKFDREAKAFKFSKRELTADVIAERNEVGPMSLTKSIKPREKHVFNLQVEINKLIERATRNNVSGKPVELLRNAALAA